MIRLVAAAVLVVHGLIHLMGFAAAWQLARIDELPYSTAILGHQVDVGDFGIG